ncbi:hypothetical protein M427DRAFT_153888 [Gonapodya prolifera JEL478]|uniref:P-loop containing nucleoside triphosphate hydrolase protein n=1 Tax=Gonapodya prolifera (strain JEL478) TaxID=1344416 RepID=A0A139AKT7_GONPJ|nr:hypothetical protein M427DRAFT_153888 [Gonapodya prolifera JEL478]|eukprot:KXS17387.1 hypothetical protein M427DRAFT_153888 [Gonapodya prolifera JEL478]
MSGGTSRGGGRGWYYKQKYGGGRSNGNQNSSPSQSGWSSQSSPGASGGNWSGPVSANDQGSIRSNQHLAQILQRIDGAQYGAYKDIKGMWRFLTGAGPQSRVEFDLFGDHIQSDAYAPPSRFRAVLPSSIAGFPASHYAARPLRLALSDYLLRVLYDYVSSRQLDRRADSSGGGWHGAKGGDFRVDRPGIQVLEQSAVRVHEDGKLEVRFTVGLPAQGRRILGQQASTILLQHLAAFLRTIHFSSLSHPGFSTRGVRLPPLPTYLDFILHDASLRAQVAAAGLVAFVPDGSILARNGGDSLDVLEGGVPFKSPESLRKSFVVEGLNPGSQKRVTGMGILKGVTLIAGGGFHGKSTLLTSLSLAHAPLTPMSGISLLVADPSTTFVRSEDGRAVCGTDISGFIGKLPGGRTTERFVTESASGSTSAAAALVEALETGAKTILIDEDTCATNFLVRDRRMQLLVGTDKEPITPLLFKIRNIVKEYDCSFILVIGGCGDYLDVADTVIALDAYEPKDVTSFAKHIALDIPTGLNLQSAGFGSFRRRVPFVPSANGNVAPAKRRLEDTTGVDGETGVDEEHTWDATAGSTSSHGRPGKTRIHTPFNVTLFGRELDLSSLQLTSVSQTRFISLAIPYLRDHVLSSAPPLGQLKWTVRMAVERLETDIEARGVEVVSQWFAEGRPEGDLARCRGVELAAALSRLRGVGHNWTQI